MGENTSIEWADHTFNPWIGCTKVSPACTRCYAADYANRYGKAKWGPNGTRVVTSDANWRKPLKWNREAEAAGVRKRVFCASLADVFEDWGTFVMDHRGMILHCCGECGLIFAKGADRACACHCRAHDLCKLDDIRARLFRLIDETPWLDWLLLTKRPENIRRMLPNWPRLFGNVWLGTTVENQECADQRIPELLKVRQFIPVLFLSMEPLLGPVNLQSACTLACPNGAGSAGCRPDDSGRRIVQDSTDGGMWVECACSRLNGIDWVIVGGESGGGARPSHPDWFRSIRDQCAGADVAFFFKQWGEWLGPMQDGAPGEPQFLNASDEPDRVGKKRAGRLLDGIEHNGFPAPEATRC